MKTFTPKTLVNELPLVGPALTKAFRNIGIETVADLLYFFPKRYIDYRKKVNISQAEEGETVTIVGRVKNVRSNFGFRGRMSYAEATLEDGTGTIKAIWFNQSYIAKQLAVGEELIVSGKVSKYKQLQLTNPSYEKISNSKDEELGTLHTGRLVPVYPRPDLIPLRTLRRIIRSCLETADELPEYFDTTKLELPPLAKAVQALHFPETEDQILTAKMRIAVDDILPQQLAFEIRKLALSKQKGIKIKANTAAIKTFLTTLSFTLTASQKRAAWDILQDMETGTPMNRLLQGDVGSGKTIVAIIAALQVVGQGYEVVLLAPTEILAKQHYETFTKLLGTNAGVALVTRNFKTVGTESKIYIGTHALLQQKIPFNNLGLLIVDEQHRFGVGQRGHLLANKSKPPHLLSMSATPIPRTLAMAMYADLKVSTLEQLPNRKPVKTKIIAENQRQTAYEFIKAEVASGRQAFVVTPRVEDNNASEVRSVKKEFFRLQSEIFPELKLELLYGKMKGADKDKIMADFSAGKIDVLVSTSVIEIGIDIPNATVMIIEGSERFGLAQLHQLRGRIGRSTIDSYCFLFTTEASHQDLNRLQALTKTNDGFVLAELDFKERGFGDLFGKQQSGFLFRFPEFFTTKALSVSQEVARELIKNDPKLKKTAPELVQRAQEYLLDFESS